MTTRPTKAKKLVQLMQLGQLLAITDRIGITLRSATIAEANLYAITDPDDNTIYIGKAKSVKRHLDEERFNNRYDRTRQIVSGFLHLVEENDAVRKPLRYEPGSFNPEKLLLLVAQEKWEGEAVTAMLEFVQNSTLTVEQVEQVLIRVHVRTGRLIGNSQFASQWEGPIGKVADTIAAVAADAAWLDGILPRHHSNR